MKKNIFLYAISTAFNRGFILLFFPFLSQMYSLSEFGQWNLVIIVSNFLLPLVCLNGFAPILREGSEDHAQGFALLKKYLVFVCVLLLLCLIVNVSFDVIFWVKYAIFISIFESFIFLILTYIRAKDQAELYCFISLTKLLGLFLILLFVRNQEYDLETLLYYHLFYLVILFIVLLVPVILKKTGKVTLNVALHSSLMFGVLLIPHGLAQWVMNGSDRLIIEFVLDSQSVGLYSIGYNIALAIGIINSGLALALPTYMIKNYQEWIASKNDNKLITLYTIFSMGLYFCLISVYLLDSVYFKFLGYYTLEILLIFSFVYTGLYLLGLYYFFANYLFYYKKSALISKLTMLIAIFNIFFTFLLLHVFGILGAAYSTLISYALYLFLIRKEAVRLEPNINIKLFNPILSVVTFVVIFTLGGIYVIG